MNLSDLVDYGDGSSVSAIDLITSIKAVTTKKGDRMAIIQLEDLTGQTEAVVFPKSYERVQAHLQADARLMLWGKVDRREEQVQFIVDDVEPVDEVRMVMVELPPGIASDIEQQHRLRTVILQHRGEEERAKIPVVAIVHNQERRYFVRFGPQFRVQNYQATISALSQAGFQARSASLIGV